MRGTAAVAGTLDVGGAAHDEQREHADQAVSELRFRQATDQAASAIVFAPPSHRVPAAAVLVLVMFVQVAWLFALGYGVFVLVR